MWTSLLRLFPLAPKLFTLICLNYAQNFEFWLSHIFFQGTANFLDLLKFHLFSIIWQSFTAIGRGSSEIWGLNVKNLLPPPRICFYFWGGCCPILVPTLSILHLLPICLKVSWQQAETARRYSATKCQKQIKNMSSKTSHY